MSIGSISGVAAIRALALTPIAPSGHPSNNLQSLEEVDLVLSQARTARINQAMSERRGTFVPNLIPDQIAQNQRFSATRVEEQTTRVGAF